MRGKKCLNKRQVVLILYRHHKSSEEIFLLSRVCIFLHELKEFLPLYEVYLVYKDMLLTSRWIEIPSLYGIANQIKILKSLF